jgi:hypothetical protein
MSQVYDISDTRDTRDISDLSDTSESTIHDYESPHKIMKYEDEKVLVQFKIAYLTKKGNILLENNKIEDSDYPEDNDDNILVIDSNNKPFKIYILNFQCIEGGDLYLIADTININKSYTIHEIFDNFMKGEYFIGTLHYYYKNNYKNGIITDVSTFNDASNDEIRLHYTKTIDYSGNVACRTIKWDLFSEFVPKDN